MEIRYHSRALIALLLTAGSLGFLVGCMTVSNQRSIVENTIPNNTFANKKIAVLPVKAQTSLAPDSVIAIRSEINKQIGQTLHGKLPTATLIDFATVSNQLNEKGALPFYEQLVATYENTGVVDKQKTAALGRALGSDFLLLARLKAEKLDIVISKSTGTSLEVSLINASTGEVTWGGSSEWKRGGILGFGEARPDEVAKSLVDLAFSSLHVNARAISSPVTQSPPATISSPPVQTVAPLDASASSRGATAPHVGATATAVAMSVLEAQKRLVVLGYDPGPQDGKMGPKMATAIRKLQQDRGIRASGVLDVETQSALR